MCLICTEWAKNPMSYNELRRNFAEISDDSDHFTELYFTIQIAGITTPDKDVPIAREEI